MRCSVDGLSLPMFVLAVLGNTMYALGIFLYSVDGVFLLHALPWIIGSVGTLFFDLTVSFLQWCMGSGSFISPGSRLETAGDSLEMRLGVWMHLLAS